MSKTRKWQARFRNSIGGILFCGARRRGRGTWLKAETLPPEVIQYLHIERAEGAAANWYQRDWKNCHKMHEECKPESHFWRSWLVLDFTVEETTPARPPAIDVDLAKLRDTLRDMNEGRNLKRYGDDGRCLGGCFDVLSFGWKDADLEPHGCTGIDKRLAVEGKRVCVHFSGHKTFCDPGGPENFDDESLSDVAQEIVCGCGSCCEWDGDSWVASYSDVVKVPVVHRSGVVNYEATSRKIIRTVEKLLEPVQDDWAYIDECLNTLYEDAEKGA